MVVSNPTTETETKTNMIILLTTFSIPLLGLDYVEEYLKSPH